MTEYTGGGDPARTLELLWGLRDRPTRGPKPRLTVEKIARSAIAIADREGLGALSMRRLADDLGVTAMSLYTYVPGKAELVDVMVDTVLGEVVPAEPVDGPWRARLERIARDNRALYRRHPWLLQVAAGRPPMGPGVMAKYEYELSAVSDTGLTDVEMDLVVSMVADYVHGAARGAVDAAQVAERSGMTDEQWWSSYAPLLEKVFDAGRYPIAARVGSAAGEEYGAAYDPARAFEFGLQRVLDGIEVLVRSRSSGT